MSSENALLERVRKLPGYGTGYATGGRADLGGTWLHAGGLPALGPRTR